MPRRISVFVLVFAPIAFSASRPAIRSHILHLVSWCSGKNKITPQQFRRRRHCMLKPSKISFMLLRTQSLTRKTQFSASCTSIASISICYFLLNLSLTTAYRRVIRPFTRTVCWRDPIDPHDYMLYLSRHDDVGLLTVLRLDL